MLTEESEPMKKRRCVWRWLLPFALFAELPNTTAGVGLANNLDQGRRIAYSTYFGGEARDSSEAVAVGPDGVIYMIGTTSSLMFPSALGVQNEDPNPGCCTDVFVARISPEGNGVDYLTIIGGGDLDFARDLAVTSRGEVYVVGRTYSADFPTRDAYQGTNAGCRVEAQGCGPDGFIAKLDQEGQLVYSTYLGGRGLDEISAVAVDRQGVAYAAGFSRSPDFPVRRALRSRKRKGADFIFLKLSATGTPRFSSFLGGRGEETYPSIAIGRAGRILIAGTTSSPDFPLRHGSSRSVDGATDAVIVSIGLAGKELLHSNLVGGRGADSASAIAVDDQGSIYMVGGTSSRDFPLVRAFQSRYSGGCCDAFLTKIGPQAKRLRFSTYLGGGGYDEAWAVSTDRTGTVNVAGVTDSEDFPALDPFQDRPEDLDCPSSSINCYNAFVGSFSQDGTPSFVSFLGGKGLDYAHGLAGTGGRIFVVGETESVDFPVESGIQPVLYGPSDSFLTEI